MSRLGIQIIVFGKRAGEDLPGVLRDVKAAGYDGAEIGNPTDATPAAELRAQFDDAGLACCGYHTGYATFKDHDLLKRTAAHMNAVGARHLMCSGVEKNDDPDAYKRSADVFNAAGALLASAGVTLAYHNHHWEFFPLAGGGRGMDLLLAHTDAAVVKCCWDVFWLACAGEDPAAFVTRHADRATYFHFKDGTFDAAAQKPLTFTELGRGDVDLAAAYAAVKALSPSWIATEQDNTQIEPAESARISAVYARQTLGV